MTDLSTKDIVLGIDAKVDKLVESHYELRGQVASALPQVIDHEARIRTLESRPRMPRASTVWGAVTATGSVLGAAVYALIR